MTIFGKVLIGAMLVTAGFLVFRGYNSKTIKEVSRTDTTTMGETQQPSDVDASNTGSIATTTNSDGNDFKGSMNDLITRGGSYKCTFDQTNDISHTTGIVFISDKHIRGDFDTRVKVLSVDTSIGSHMISDGDFIYTWSGEMPTGFKLPVDIKTSAATPNSQSFDYNQKLDYNCTSWTIDPDKFILPSGIEFKGEVAQ